ncbi:MAG: hypothetical protein KY447_03575 [Actinobacteria bacterium]|nr:hypothetical protein [Actinomycetota bacterium]
MLHTALMGVHIVAGAAGLLLGPLAMTAAVRGSRPSRGAAAYQAAVAVICLTTLGLVALDWRRWWPFVFLAVGTEMAAAGGWWVGRSRRGAWRGRHVRLVCGSYISLVTALFVVTLGSPLAWVMPTVVGTVLVERAANAASAPAAS